MATLRILTPEATTNYIKNPSPRYDTTGYTAFGSTVSRSLSYSRFSIASIKVITNGLLLSEGTYYRVNALQGISGQLTVSAYVIGSGSVRIRLIDYPTGKEWASQPVILRSDRWTRIEATGRATGSNDVRLYMETYKNAPQAATFYVDGAQMERKNSATSYCDGEQPGCRWNILSYNSHSTREASTRAGGKWVQLTGEDRPQEDLYMTVAGGLGMAPLSLNTQSYALLPGSFFQNHKILARPITFTFHAKNKADPRQCEVSLSKLHALRQYLLDLVKPDVTGGDEDFWLEYQDGATPVYFQARYEGGLEGEWDTRNQWTNSFPIRLLAVSPLFREDDQQVASLNFRSNATINYIMMRKDGVWAGMNGGFNGQVLALAIGSRGEIIAVGSFTYANNSSTAISPTIPANRIAYWDGEKWNQYGTGANGTIYDVAVAANGYVYVVGDFTSIGGVAANRAAYWNGSTWNAMGSGLNGIGYAVAVSSNGDVYVGGAFTTAGGNNVYRCARWDGSSWQYLGAQGGLNGIVRTIAISSDGSLVFLGGDFTDEYGDPGILELNYVAQYEPSTNQFSALDVGFDASVYKLRMTEGGILYAGGAFTQSFDTLLALLYTAYWNGAGWYSYGVGANNTVRDLNISKFGNILAAGDFSRIGSEDALYAALWNGSSFVNLDLEVDNACYAILTNNDEDIIVAPNGTAGRFARQNTVTNRGTAQVSPMVYIKGPATLRWLENQTSKKRIYADLDLLNGEEVFIDFAQGTVLSSTRGNLIHTIKPGSDLRAWTLLPGDNVISALLLNDIAALMQISYIPSHWSADSTAQAV